MVELNDILTPLGELVACNTVNPPREITADGPLVQTLRKWLPTLDIEVEDIGNGSLIIEAKRGQANNLFNVHLDTVPVAPGWSQDPFTMTRGDDRATGLGTCDIKGAAACLIALAASTDAPLHYVFTTDEEAGTSACIRHYVETRPAAPMAIIAEPTQTEAILAHRGIFSSKLEFTGQSAHSSTAQAKSAVHAAARWAVDALGVPGAAENRLNIGRIEGGVKPNMIAGEAEILFGFRNAPGVEQAALLDHLQPLVEEHGGTLTPRFSAPALPADTGGPAAAAQDRAKGWCKERDIPLGAPVDFFTEAAFFAAAGVPAAVLGPGNIAQAHTADEWVAYDSLLSAYALYEKIATHG